MASNAGHPTKSGTVEADPNEPKTGPKGGSGVSSANDD